MLAAPFEERFSSWRKVIASMPDPASRFTVFANAANDVASCVARGLAKTDAVDALFEMAESNGLTQPSVDEVQTVIADAFANVVEGRAPTNGHDTEPPPIGEVLPPLPRILSLAEFLAAFVAPDYLVDGLLQRRFLYALTGQTGHAKTAVALLIAQLVASTDRNAMLGKRRVDKGRVIYFVGENPDDVRYRVIASHAQRSDEPTADNLWFIPGVFNIAHMLTVLRADCQRNGEAALIIVDTSAAYFPGNEELSNTQMGAYARMLRQLTTMPGGPCVLVLCHPIKHVQEPSQLLPRGGGAYLAEVDGNLTLWRVDDDIIELHHTKIRGPGFPAISFKLEPVTSTKLTDKKGRPFSSVRAVVISDTEEEQQKARTLEDDDRLLAAMLAKPTDVGGSFAVWAQDLGWVTPQGEAQKKRVERIIKRLSKNPDKLTAENRGRWYLTDDGKEVARKAALRFEANRQRNAQGSLL